MWLLTPRGFYSVVADREQPDWLLVRARARDDLESLAELVSGLAIEYTPERDYAWRTRMTRRNWEQLAALLGSEIDYPNFKNAVAAAQGPERAAIYGRVWSTLL